MTTRISQSDVSSIVSSIEHILICLLKCLLEKIRINKNEIKKKTDKPWFSQACRIARHAYHNARKQYNRYKSNYNKHNLRVVSKSYKSTISRSV